MVLVFTLINLILVMKKQIGFYRILKSKVVVLPDSVLNVLVKLFQVEMGYLKI